MPVVDASVYVALIRSEEEAHEACWAWLNAAVSSGEEIIAPTLLVAEVGAAIARGVGQPTLAKRAVQQILSQAVIELLPVTCSLAERAAAIAIEHRIRGADAVYVALAEHSQDLLITLDRQQLERGAAAAATWCPVD